MSSMHMCISNSGLTAVADLSGVFSPRTAKDLTKAKSNGLCPLREIVSINIGIGFWVRML